MADHIEIRGARVHNLKNIDVDVPLNEIVGIAGVSGSGKSSLALGVLYAEGSRRYLESLSTYTRRRMTGAARADVDEILYVPAALALHQRPAVPGIRSTFGTGTELLNSLRLMYSRLAEHRCPNGHYLAPSLAVAAGQQLVCPVCGAVFSAPSAEELAFNSQGACKTCGGTGIVQTVDEATLVPDESLTIEEGAVAPWNSLMWSLMVDVCRAMGVRTDVPFRSLTAAEKEIVYHGPAVKKHILYKAKSSNQAGELDFTYFNAVYTVQNALAKVKDESGMKRVEKFLKQDVCPDCGGTRLSAAARAPRICGISLDEACRMTLSDLAVWVNGIPMSLPAEMRPMAENICLSFSSAARRLLDLGLGYLTLERTASTLSTGERQRMQLARAVRNRTTGVLYVLDEPSIGLHPVNIAGLVGVMRDLVADGNSVVLVDHDAQILSVADHIIEMGPEAGARGGTVIAQGTVSELIADPSSKIGPFLGERRLPPLRPRAEKGELFSLGSIRLSTDAIHTVHPILESLVPALQAKLSGKKLPAHVRSVEAEGISQVKLIDATPIGINVRSTVATYANVHDELRKIFARTEDARRMGYKAGDFSYNTGRLRCPVCDGTGLISLDVQFLPDVDISCTECRGARYAKAAHMVHYRNKAGESYTLPALMAMDVHTALAACAEMKLVRERLNQGDEVFYIGKKRHPEAEAVCALSEHVHLITKEQDIPACAEDAAIFVTNQTTMSVYDVRQLFEQIKARYPQAHISEEICNATRIRQQAVADLKGKHVDVLYVVGDTHSNNTKRLAQIGAQQGIPRVLLIDSIQDIEDEQLQGAEVVAVTSGASTSRVTHRAVQKLFQPFVSKQMPPIGMSLDRVWSGGADCMQQRRLLLMTDRTEKDTARLPQPEDFWLELGPPSAYYGTDAYETALREGDASPDAKRLGWTGAEPGRGSQDDTPPADR